LGVQLRRKIKKSKSDQNHIQIDDYIRLGGARPSGRPTWHVYADLFVLASIFGPHFSFHFSGFGLQLGLHLASLFHHFGITFSSMAFA
jgi:hypothetical protein